MNRLFKNKFIRDNLVLLVVMGLLFPQSLFADAWVADTDNNQVSRIYKDGHAPTVFEVVRVIALDTISVNMNPTALFYPGLKLSFGLDRANVYEIDSINFDAVEGWLVSFTTSLSPTDDVTDSPIYMELVRAGGFNNPVAVSTNAYNKKVWIADNSITDAGITQLTGWGREEPSDTPLVKPDAFSFWDGETEFNLYSQDRSIYQGIKIDFSSDNRAGNVLETDNFDIATNLLTTIDFLPSTHSIIGKTAAVIHTDRFRDKIPNSPVAVAANSTDDRISSEYDIAWAANTDDNSVVKYEKWQYRRTLTLDPTDIDADLTDFPLCVMLNNSRINYANTKTNGEDIRFSDADGNVLKYEIEKWDNTGADTSVIWVKVPEISSDPADATIIYMYYGNPDAEDAQDTENVWDPGYMMVQHLEETDTSIVYDSTFNGNEGTFWSSGIPANLPILSDSGQVNGACRFSSDTEYIEIPDNSNNTLDINNQITIEAWIKGTSFGDTDTIITKGVNTTWANNNYSAGLIENGKPFFVWGNQDGVLASGTLLSGTWYHLAFVAEPGITGNLKLYINGELEKENTKTAIPVTNGEPLRIGTDADNATGNFFNVIIDEVRISNTARSDTWLKACFHSEKDELINFGEEENVRYAGILKVGGFKSPQSISVNSSNGEVWEADTGDSEVVKLSKDGHKAINAIVDKYHSQGATTITLTDTSQLDTGIKISFNKNPADVYLITAIISDTQIEIEDPGLNESLRGAPPIFAWIDTDTPLLVEDKTYDAFVPLIAMDGDNAVVVWYQSDGTNTNIYSNYSDDGGASWEYTDAPLLLEEINFSYLYPHQSLAMSGNNVVAVWNQNDGTDISIYSNHSDDGGASWDPAAAQPVEQTTYSADNSEVAISGNNVVAVWVQSDGTNDNIYSNYSNDGGESWEYTADPLLLETRPYNAALPRLAMSGNNVVAVWVQSDGTNDNIYSNYSDDYGASWEYTAAPLLLETADYARYPAIAMDGNKVVVVWRQLDGTYFSIYSNYSDDGGASWKYTDAPLLLETNPYDVDIRPPEVAMSGNNVVAVWSQQNGTGSNDIYTNYSSNGGASWGTARLLETISGGAGLPQVAISGNNAVIIWLQNDGTYASVYANYSTDGGEFWGGTQLIEKNSYNSGASHVAISGNNTVAVWGQKDGVYTSLYSNHTDFTTLPLSIPVGRELARVSGFVDPVSVSVNSDTELDGDCWVADKGNNTVVWLSGKLGRDDITTAGYDITKDSGYHKIIKGFNNPVSVAVDPLSGDCWVACDGDGADSYIVRLDNDVSDNYNINNPSSGFRHVKVYGFNSPKAVSVDPSTGDCYVADGTNGGQIVRLSPRDPVNTAGGHRYTGYVADGSLRPLDGTYHKDESIIYLLLDTEAVSYDTPLYSPLKISFGEPNSNITPVYSIESVNYNNPVAGKVMITLSSPLVQDVTGGTRFYRELARVGGFSSPSGISAFKGDDLGEGLHPWLLQVREFYMVDDEKYPSEDNDDFGWRSFPAGAPVHDATPQFRWSYVDVDGTDTTLKSYQIQIYTLDNTGYFKEVWDSGSLQVRNIVEIYPGNKSWIHTDWDIIASAIKQNDSTSIYSKNYGTFDDDDCPDISQKADATENIGDRKYYVRLTVVNNGNIPDSYPLSAMKDQPFSVVEAEAPYITFTLDKTPPGAYKVCGTEELVPSIDGNTSVLDENKYYIKENFTSTNPSSPEVITEASYYQDDNYYWNEVWVEWDGGDTEIVKETENNLWVPKKQMTVRVKVKDKNNENQPKVGEPDHKGYGLTEELQEDSANCSGISRKAQYRVSLATSPSAESSPPAERKWSDWLDCDEVRRYDEDALMSNKQGERLLAGGVKDEFVWLYAKNVIFADGDTNLIQFRVLDEGYLEISRILEPSEMVNSDTDKEIWITPNMGYSHADTAIWTKFGGVGSGREIKFQIASDEYGYKIPVDSNIPQVVLVEYPSNPYPHTYASFAWTAIDTTPCRFKWRLEQWDWKKISGKWQWDMDDSWDYGLGDDGSGGSKENKYSNNENRWLSDATSTNFTDLVVGKWYVFRIKAKDREGALCGSLGPSPCARRVSDEVVWAWYVSPEVPDTIITYGPSGQTSGDFIFRYRGVGGMPPYTYQYRITGEDWESTTDEHIDKAGIETAYDPFVFETGKTYTFQVRAGSDLNGDGVIVAGEKDPTPAKRTFTIVDLSHPPYSAISPQNLYKYFRDIGE